MQDTMKLRKEVLATPTSGAQMPAAHSKWEYIDNVGMEAVGALVDAGTE